MSFNTCEVVTLGETMVLFIPCQAGPLRYVNEFQKRLGGAESNVAIGLARLGHSCRWISRIGDDEFGRFLYKEIKGEGVDVSCVMTDPHAPTGIMFKEKIRADETRVHYYRSGSAASRMAPEDLKPGMFAGSKILHLTGITPALGDSCIRTVYRSLEIAKEQGITISFDPNIRLKLWNRETAAKAIRELIPLADIVLCGLDEGKIIYGTDDARILTDKLLSSGVGTVAVKMGADGCWLASSDELYRIDAFNAVSAVDPVGAGDAFAAGFLAGILEGKGLAECGRLANAMGAFAVTTAGDFEGLPQRPELEAFLSGQSEVMR